MSPRKRQTGKADRANRLRRLSSLLLLAFLCAASSAETASAGSAGISVGGMSYRVPVQSIQATRFSSVEAQRYDFSCGAAAVATLLTHHYDDPVNEIEAFTFMFESGDREKIRREGFSLLDMKRFLEARGYPADGYRVSLEDVQRTRIPAIVLVNFKGFRHFVVVKGIDGGQVLVGDPASGIMRYDLAEFRRYLVNDIVFVVRSHRQVAEASFNHESDWAAFPAAPVGGINRLNNLMPVTLLLPGRNEF